MPLQDPDPQSPSCAIALLALLNHTLETSAFQSPRSWVVEPLRLSDHGLLTDPLMRTATAYSAEALSMLDPPAGSTSFLDSCMRLKLLSFSLAQFHKSLKSVLFESNITGSGWGATDELILKAALYKKS